MGPDSTSERTDPRVVRVISICALWLGVSLTYLFPFLGDAQRYVDNVGQQTQSVHQGCGQTATRSR